MPKLITIQRFRDEYGPSRTATYALLGAGKLRARKVGSRTFIETDSADEWMNSLPPPIVKAPPTHAGATA